MDTEITKKRTIIIIIIIILLSDCGGLLPFFNFFQVHLNPKY
jgi:hypothetical protein